VLIATDMAAQIAEEVHGAALLRRAEDPGERGLQSRMGVADRLPSPVHVGQIRSRCPVEPTRSRVPVVGTRLRDVAGRRA
jgi:hypothetical protein